MPDHEVDALGRVLAAVQAQDAARIELAAAVAAARAAGHTWAQLGDALGMTRQAVFKRFGGGAAEPVAERARSVAALVRGATGVFADLDAGRVEQVRAGMAPHAAQVLTAEVLIGTWSAVVRLLGPFEGCADGVVERADRSPVEADGSVRGPAVVGLTLRYERGERAGRVAYDGAGRISGVLILPPGSPSPF